MNNRIITSFLLLILAPVVLFAQKVELTGRVVDTHGEPVIAAGVLIQGTSQGVVTDFEGNFSISVEKGQTIEFSSVGFKTLTILFNGQSRLNITLEDETTILDEVVVIGYGTMKKREMTSAISHVASKDLNHVTSLDAKMLLQGKVSGVTVSNTALADPNQQGSIQIRGLSSGLQAPDRCMLSMVSRGLI